MKSIMMKPFSFSIAITSFVLGVYGLSLPVLFITGIMSIIGGFFIFNSISGSNVKLFICGQAFIYMGLGAFFVKVLEVAHISFLVLVIISGYIFHKTLLYILTIEYGDEIG